MNLDTAQLDRAHGVLLATAAGDALGAGYEFGPPLPPETPVTMTGGGPFRWAPRSRNGRGDRGPRFRSD